MHCGEENLPNAWLEALGYPSFNKVRVVLSHKTRTHLFEIRINIEGSHVPNSNAFSSFRFPLAFHLEPNCSPQDGFLCLGSVLGQGAYA